MALNRSNYIVLFDANDIKGITSDTPDLVRVDKSTVYDFNANPQTTTYSYIDSPDDTTEVTGYQKSMEQEIALIENNRCFQLIDDYFWRFETGAGTHIKTYFARPEINEDGSFDKTKWKAQLYKDATIVVKTLNTQDKKYTYTFNANGNPTHGYITKDSNGGFVFTEGDLPSNPPAEEEEGGGIETQSLSSTLKASKATSSK